MTWKMTPHEVSGVVNIQVGDIEFFMPEDDYIYVIESDYKYEDKQWVRDSAFPEFAPRLFKEIADLIRREPEVNLFNFYHYVSYSKLMQGMFWETTYHGRRSWTHNTIADLVERMAHPEREKLIKVDFDHPLKGIC